MAVLFLSIALAGCGRPSNQNQAGPSTPKNNISTANGSNGGTPGISNSGPWPTKLVPIAGGTRSLRIGPQGLYALAAQPPLPAAALSAARVLKFDPASQAVSYSQPIAGAVTDQVAGGTVWVLVIPGTKTNCVGSPVMLDRLDPSSLQLLQRIVLPGAIAQQCTATLAAAQQGALWAGVGRHLYRINASTGIAGAPTSVPGAKITSMSVQLSGGPLYVAQTVTGGGSLVTEINSANESIVRSRIERSSSTGGTVSASPNGVWYSTSAGSTGRTTLLQEGTLRAQPLDLAKTSKALKSRSGGLPESPFTSKTSVLGTQSGGTLWLSGSRFYACADPMTGSIRAYSFTPLSSQPPIAVGIVLFVTSHQGILIVHPPASCYF